MINALGMNLRIIRTVIQNEVNDIYVCTDEKQSQSQYTMIAIHSKEVAKNIAGRISVSALFEDSRDYVGSFLREDAYHLVFNHTQENLLQGREDIFLANFKDAKLTSLSFLVAMAEAGFPPDIGVLLINKGCISVNKLGMVNLNYFLDFENYIPDVTTETYYRKVANYAFDLLSYKYRLKYAVIDDYPYELQVFHKKAQLKSYRSFAQMIADIKKLPEELREQRFGIFRLLDRFYGAKEFFLRNSAKVITVVVVCVTLVYVANQLVNRVYVNKDTSSMRYTGMDYIGEVYLGEENI